MAKKQAEGCSFKTEIKQLKTGGPERLYLIYGPEDHLSAEFLRALREQCLPDGDDGFSLKVFDGPDLDLSALEQATDSIPFLSERVFVELRNIDTNKVSDADRFAKILDAIPEYCTAAFFEDAVFVPDGRLKTNKYLKSHGKVLYFDSPSEGEIIKWIQKRFSAAGQNIGAEECRHLMFTSGTKMNRLIPEIDKISAFVSGDTVGIEHIRAVASRIPEADIFELINCISSGKKDDAVRLLADILADKKNEPIAILALLSYQLRKLYGVRLILDSGGGRQEIGSLLKSSWDKMISETTAQARAFTVKKLASAIERCADTDYQMKSSSADDADLLKSFVISLLL